ncbi:trigger factor [Alysiella filiformis]|uniref:Trigger factor n=1 Tax=Alysiella filiformis DSM 16848 TaxID=1120981 RepID=A0A286E3N9_9NEIS|nr:trigger factor [Alysiella filiformis]QMT31067.1 trigger factor [Alysiella filiformis]UBQ55942.1 trigger factor [Alysiella filiformis DSM 16848]SOD65525.1 trigger factor [Alysiella filiformis DSM 16848]
MATIEKLENLERKLVVTVKWDDINAEFDKRLKQTAKKAKIDGFRPGHAPIKMVAQMYGASIQNEVLNDLAQAEFNKEMIAQQVRIADLLRVDAVEGQENNTETFQAAFIFEVLPEINLADLSGLNIEKSVANVNDAEIDQTIEILRKQRTRYNRVERGAQNNDRVIIDFVGKIDGELFDGGSSENYPFVLGQGQMLPEFEAGILGMKEGESKDVSVNFPEDYHGKEVAGKTAVFTITVHNVAEAELPQVDEAFAKALGIADGDVSKMREEVKKNVSREVKRRTDAQNVEAVMAALRDAHSFDLPRSLVNEEAARLAEEMKQNFAQQGLDAKDLNLPVEMFIDRAEERVKLGLILPALVEANKLQPTEEQIKNIVNEFAESYEDPQEVVAWYYADRERLQGPSNLALEANVVAFVLGKAKVTEKTLNFDEVMGAGM